MIVLLSETFSSLTREVIIHLELIAHYYVLLGINKHFLHHTHPISHTPMLICFKKSIRCILSPVLDYTL